MPVTKNPTGDEPNISQYFFPKVRPLVEKALTSRDRKNWPLYPIDFYHMNGHAAGAAASQGWEEESNFGSAERGKLRWNACMKAGVDFISTDQYEEVAALIRQARR